MGVTKAASKEVKCACDGWKLNMPKITGYETLAYIHGFDVDIETFKFCPWC